MSKDLRVGKIEEKIFDDFIKIVDERNISRGKLFTEYYELNNLFDFNFTDEEKDDIAKIKEVLPDALAQRFRKCITSLSKRIDGLGSKETIVGSRNSTNSGFMRIKNIVDEMMKNNDEAKEWYDKRFINQKSIFDHGQQAKQMDDNKMGVGVNSIKQYMSVNKTSIKEHHVKHDIDKSHNLKVHYFKMNEKKKRVK